MRSAHIVDIENLMAPREEQRCFQAVFEHYLQLAAWQQGDVVVIAANRNLARSIAFEVSVPHRFLVAALEPDAADHCLLEFTAGRWLETAVDRVVLGSGDGIFADLLGRLEDAAVSTVVVARPGTVSRHLRRNAREMHLMRELGLRVPCASREAAGATEVGLVHSVAA